MVLMQLHSDGDLGLDLSSECGNIDTGDQDGGVQTGKYSETLLNWIQSCDARTLNLILLDVDIANTGTVHFTGVG